MVVEKIFDLFFGAINFIVNLLPRGIVQAITKPVVPLPLRYGS